MNPEAASLLEQLRDIHGAPPAPWWPPAPGWWLLAALLLIVLYLLTRRGLAAMRRRRRRRELQAALEFAVSALDPAREPRAWLAVINRAFKRVALDAFPEEACAGYQGQDWVDFVQGQLQQAGVSADVGVLAEGPYQPRPEFDPDALLGAARQWIRHYG